MKQYTKTLGTILFLCALVLGIVSCAPQLVKEKKVTELVLPENITTKDGEFSSLTWYKENLILLPQYPDRFATDHYGKLFAIPKTQILTYLDGITNTGTSTQTQHLQPIGIELIDNQEVLKKIKGFEGFEAIGFYGERVFMSIEAKPNGMLGHLVSGEIKETPENQWEIILQDKIADIPVQADLPNSSYETLLVTQNELILIYEGNGEIANKKPHAMIYSHDLEFIRSVPFPHVEFRITDATELDHNNQFWCINYIWPKGRERYKTSVDTIVTTYGNGKTHSQCGIIERLLEFEYKNNEIVLVKKPPIYFQLEDYNDNCQLDSDDSRNWEGIVRLKSDRYNGFLIITDEFPRTMLGYVPREKE